MAAKKYTIVKYKGKHKIKDTKSGKSVEIDIEKYMKGGEKTSKYMFGGEECPEGYQKDSLGNCMPTQQGPQLKNLEVERLNFINQAKNNNSYPNYTQAPNQLTSRGFSQEELLNQRQNFIDENRQTPQQKVDVSTHGLITEDKSAELLQQNTPTTEQIAKGIKHYTPYSEKETYNQEELDYNIPNLYGGVDIPSAAHFLGQSIENKNGLGIAAGGLKVAAGLARNVFSGIGQQNRYNQVMKDHMDDKKKSRNPWMYAEDGGQLESFAYGGKKDEELATGEYMHGISNETTEPYNAEIEKGEYFQTNEGDIAEVVGDKHSQGGEKIQMEPEDRVLSDKLKLGAKTAQELSEKYGLKLRAKDTYSKVLDKYRTKSKLNKVIEEEAEILKKIGEQDKVEDLTTRNFNLDVLTKKKAEIDERKHPLEEQRKEMFEELFNIQEDSKPKEESQEDLEYGGNLESLAMEYNIPLDRAKRIVEEFSKGGKMPKKYMEGGIQIGDVDPITGKKVTKEEAKRKVDAGEWESLGGDKYVQRGTPSQALSTESLQSYRATWDKNKFPNFEDYVSAAEKWKLDNPDWDKKTVVGTPDQHFFTQDQKVQSSPASIVGGDTDIIVPELLPRTFNRGPEIPQTTEGRITPSKKALAGGIPLFPDETPLAPTSLQGTIKPERRFDRVRPTEIEVEPYLQDIRDREQIQIQNLEGLPPNLRAAVLANVRANTQTQESRTRNQIDTQNLQSQEKAIYRNADIQRIEENASEVDRLNFERRTYRAQANQDRDLNDYYNQLQAINKSRFKDISDLNLINANNPDVAYIPGRGYVRKTSDEELIKRIRT